MKAIEPIRRVASLAVCALCATLACAGPDTTGRPNVLLITVDTLRADRLGCYGYHIPSSPQVDRLAAEGMVFTSAYSNGPNCAPSRACPMSGLYSPRHGVYTVGSSERGQAKDRKLVPTPNETVLADRFVTIAEILREAGYATASIGKWHLGADPRTQGFDVNVAGYEAGMPFAGYFSPYDNPKLPDGPEGEHLTARTLTLGEGAFGVAKLLKNRK